jgi:hypothetical protein
VKCGDFEWIDGNWCKVKWDVTDKILGTKVPCTLGWTYTEGTWIYCEILCCGCFDLFCNVWVCVYVYVYWLNFMGINYEIFDLLIGNSYVNEEKSNSAYNTVQNKNFMWIFFLKYKLLLLLILKNSVTMIVQLFIGGVPSKILIWHTVHLLKFVH